MDFENIDNNIERYNWNYETFSSELQDMDVTAENKEDADNLQDTLNEALDYIQTMLDDLDEKLDDYEDKESEED